MSIPLSQLQKQSPPATGIPLSQLTKESVPTTGIPLSQLQKEPVAPATPLRTRASEYLKSIAPGSPEAMTDVQDAIGRDFTKLAQWGGDTLKETPSLITQAGAGAGALLLGGPLNKASWSKFNKQTNQFMAGKLMNGKFPELEVLPKVADATLGLVGVAAALYAGPQIAKQEYDLWKRYLTPKGPYFQKYFDSVVKEGNAYKTTEVGRWLTDYLKPEQKETILRAHRFLIKPSVVPQGGRPALPPMELQMPAGTPPAPVIVPPPIAVESKLATIPDFKSTQEAYKYGESIKDNPRAIAQLMKARNTAVLEYNKTLKTVGPMKFKDAYSLSLKGKYLKDAHEAALNPDSVAPEPAPVSVDADIHAKLYENGKAREAKVTPPVGLSVEPVSGYMVKATTPEQRSAINRTLASIRRAVDKRVAEWEFVPPKIRRQFPQLKDDYRTHIIGGNDYLKNKVTNETAMAIWGGMSKEDIETSAELVFRRNDLERAVKNIGNPLLTVEEAKAALTELESQIKNPQILEAASIYKVYARSYTAKLVVDGKIAENSIMEDYAPRYTIDYLPEDIRVSGNIPKPFVGMPSKLRTPYRGYTMRARGSEKPFRRDSGALLQRMLEIDRDNLVEDFMTQQAEKYDIIPKLTKEDRLQLFGGTWREYKGGMRLVPNRMRPGQVRTINGIEYIGWAPSTPYNRVLYPLIEDEEYEGMMLGGFKKTYALPRDIVNFFNHFTEDMHGVPLIARDVAKVQSYWKNIAILTHFPGFNVNNFVGDAIMQGLQIPNPARFFAGYPSSIRLLLTKESDMSPETVKFFQWMLEGGVLDAAFIQNDLPMLKGVNPLSYMLAKARVASGFRENVSRVTLARYLYDEMNAGKGEAMRKYYSHVDTRGLDLNSALRKIAREAVVDYNAQSKMYKSWIRNGLLPFGWWFIKASVLLNKMMFGKNWWKVLPLLASVPIATQVWNNSGKRREINDEMPDYIRDGTPYVILPTSLLSDEYKDEYGQVNIMKQQLPADVLMGTKWVSVLVNEAGKVMMGKNAELAAKDALSTWGIREGEGAVSLLSPIVRFFRGIAMERDPYTKEPIYPIDPASLPPSQVLYYQHMFFIKTFMPPFSPMLTPYKIPSNFTTGITSQLKDNFFSAKVFGFYKVNPEQRIYIGNNGEHMGNKEFNDMRAMEQIENNDVFAVADAWMKSGLTQEQFFAQPETQAKLANLAEFHGARAGSVLKRIMTGTLKNPVYIKNWMMRNFQNASDPAEKKFYIDGFRTWDMIGKMMKLGKTPPPLVMREAQKVLDEGYQR